LYPRITGSFPIKITPDFLGNTVNLSESGLSFILDKPLLLTKTQAKIELSPEESIETEFKIIWNKHLIKEGKFTYGACFVRLKEKDLNALRLALIKLYTGSTLEKLQDAESKEKVWNYWNKDFKKFLDKLIEVSDNLYSANIDKKKAEEIITEISDTVLHKGDELEICLNNEIIIKKVKRAFRELCGPWVYRSKIVKHAFEKPRGYPGDYNLLEIIYDNKAISEDIGFCYDRYFLNNAYAVAVRSRKDKMREILTDFIRNFNIKPLKILNLACGSCREIKELFIDKKFTFQQRIEFSLVDQDNEALELCKSFLKDNSMTSFKFLQHNVLEYIRDSEKYQSILDKYDMIYTIGLADYLPDRILKNLLSFCFTLLNSDGKLIIAHKDISKYKPLAPNWACDWNFYPRDQDYLIKMINESGINNFRLKIEREPSRVILFLILTKV